MSFYTLRLWRYQHILYICNLHITLWYHILYSILHTTCSFFTKIICSLLHILHTPRKRRIIILHTTCFFSKRYTPYSILHTPRTKRFIILHTTFVKILRTTNNTHTLKIQYTTISVKGVYTTYIHNPQNVFPCIYCILKLEVQLEIFTYYILHTLYFHLSREKQIY